MNKSCQDATWLGWVKMLPDEMVTARPVLSLDYGWSLLICGELEACDARLQDAERGLDLTAEMNEGPDASSTGMIVVDEEQFRTMPASIANARAYRAQALGDVPGTLKYSRQALDLLPEDDWLKRAVPAALMGFIHLESGDLEEAHRSFTDLKASFKMGGDISYISFTFILADIRMVQGRLKEATSIYEQSIQIAADQGEPMPLGTEDLYRGISELHYELGDLETAREYLQRSEELSKQSKSMEGQYNLCLAHARLKDAEGDLDSALDLLDKAERLYVRNPMPDLRPVAALKTRVWIGQGKLAEALGWARERGLSYDDNLNYLHEFEHVTLARLLIALYKSEGEDRYIHEAMGLLERLLTAAEEGERTGSVIEILVLQTLAHEAQANIPLGLVPLEHALALAEPEGYVRIFVDEGIPMAQLLSEAAAHGIMPDYTGKLVAVFEAGQQKP
jgi:LuxR family maltose regulon positive regulatory protein